MAYLPCLNPNCKSHGKPHPNCRCYANMQKGGEVTHFCSEARMHDESCEYYADGGEIPSDQVVLDSSSPQEEIDPSQVQLDQPKEEIPNDQVVLDSDKYSTPEQQKITALEGVGQGLVGPVAPWVETHLMGVDPQDISGRQQTNPFIHGASEAGALAASMYYGVGEARLIGAVASKVPEIAALGKVGSAALRGAIQSVSFQGSDEVTRAMLSQPGANPEHPVSAGILGMGGARLLGAAATGAVTGGVFGLFGQQLEKGVQTLKSQKMIDAAQNYLSELGAEGDPLGKLGITEKISSALKTSAVIPASAAGAAALSAKTGGLIPFPVTFSLLQDRLNPIAEKIAGKAVGKVNPYVTDAIIKSLLTNETTAVPNAIQYGVHVTNGVKSVAKAIESIFMAGGQQLVAPAIDEAKQIDEFLKNGGVDKQVQNSFQNQNATPAGYAKGGEVTTQPGPETQDRFANVFPEQNILLNQAKGRISNYLNSLRPIENQARLAFDDEPKNKEKERSYDKALEIAAKPLSILNHMQDGSLTPEHMQHFTAMYPEVHRYLSEKLTDRITKAQLSGEKPNYAKRQAMSLFLGTALDSTLTPQAIQAAQGVFMQQKAATQAAPTAKPKKSSASTFSKISEGYLGDSEASAKRQQIQKV